MDPRPRSLVLVVHTSVITILHHLPKSMAKSATNTHRRIENVLYSDAHDAHSVFSVVLATLLYRGCK